MANVLSQSEIDELLNALTAGGDVETKTEEKKPDEGVRLYDFRTANKFSKEHMRTLNIVFDNFAYLLSTRLTGMLRTIVEVNVISVEEQLFGEFNNSIPSPAVLGVIEMEPLQGNLLIDVSSTLAYGIISRLLGGVADNGEGNKAFTEIELVILESIVHKMLGYLGESWEKIIDVRPRLIRIETNSQFTQISALNEPAAIVTINVKVDSVEDMMTVCIPHVALQPIAKKLSSTVWMLGNQPVADENRGQNEAIKQQIDNTRIRMSARFDEIDVPIRDVLNLQVGDILSLDHSINQYITINLEHIPKFKGVIGVCGNKQAVQITEVIKENYDIEQ